MEFKLFWNNSIQRKTNELSYILITITFYSLLYHCMCIHLAYGYSNVSLCQMPNKSMAPESIVFENDLNSVPDNNNNNHQ